MEISQEVEKCLGNSAIQHRSSYFSLFVHLNIFKSHTQRIFVLFY